MNPLTVWTVTLAAVVASAVSLATLVIVWFGALCSLRQWALRQLPDFLAGVNAAIVTAVHRGQLPTDSDVLEPAHFVPVPPRESPICLWCKHFHFVGGPEWKLCGRNGKCKTRLDTCEHFDRFQPLENLPPPPDPPSSDA